MCTGKEPKKTISPLTFRVRPSTVPSKTEWLMGLLLSLQKLYTASYCKTCLDSSSRITAMCLFLLSFVSLIRQEHARTSNRQYWFSKEFCGAMARMPP